MTAIALFGASGRLGQHVLLRALTAGCTVRALVRDPATIETHSRRLTLVTGDVLDPDAVAQTLEGAEVVVSLIGPRPGVRGSTLLADSARALLDGMRAAGVERIFTVTWVAVLSEGDRPRLADHAVRLIARTLFPDDLADAARHVALLRASDAVWTVVRAPALTDELATGRVRVGVMGETGSLRVSRDDLATFLVDAVLEDRYARQLPFVTE